MEDSVYPEDRMVPGDSVYPKDRMVPGDKGQREECFWKIFLWLTNWILEKTGTSKKKHLKQCTQKRKRASLRKNISSKEYFWMK